MEKMSNKKEYKIPEGYEARIDGNKVIIEKKESESERIRKELLDYCKNRAEKYPNDPKYKNISAWIAWLDKKDEQKPADKIEPKFKVGDKVKSVIDWFECTIESIDNTCYYGDTTNFDIQDQDGWELVEQKLEWSEEDESNLNSAIYYIRREPYRENDVEPIVDWLRNKLKSLRPQSTWKPTHEQLNALYERVLKGGCCNGELMSLYNDLLKLKE